MSCTCIIVVDLGCFSENRVEEKLAYLNRKLNHLPTTSVVIYWCLGKPGMPDLAHRGGLLQSMVFYAQRHPEPQAVQCRDWATPKSANVRAAERRCCSRCIPAVCQGVDFAVRKARSDACMRPNTRVLGLRARVLCEGVALARVESIVMKHVGSATVAA